MIALVLPLVAYVVFALVLVGLSNWAKAWYEDRKRRAWRK